jgi:uncharacterized protein YecE (DUF72 family)
LRLFQLSPGYLVDYEQVKVGCCGFPSSREKYASMFPVIEVQQTFYQPPRVSTLQRWRAAAPGQFEFTVKAWQLITHWSNSPTYRRLTSNLSDYELQECGGFQPTDIVQEAWVTTRACAEALGAKWLLFQCPPNFTPTDRNIENLKRFFEKVDRRKLGFLWEPRGVWPDGLVESLCRNLDLVHAVDPFLRRPVTRDLYYYRLHGGKNYQHVFNSAELTKLLAAVPKAIPSYVMFNNVAMLENGLAFQELVQGKAITPVA